MMVSHDLFDTRFLLSLFYERVQDTTNSWMLLLCFSLLTRFNGVLFYLKYLMVSPTLPYAFSIVCFYERVLDSTNSY